MTTPVPVKATKSWIALVGTLLVPIGALIAQFSGYLPEPWGVILAGVGGVISLITKQVVYQVPNKPIEPVVPVPPPASGGGYSPPPAGGWTNPYRK